jgi:hypothetical protein
MANVSRLPGGEPVTDMSATTSSIEWYLAREGQQFGPITDAELAEFIKRGHLQPNDLLWREGFSEWRPAMVVFPAIGQSAAQPKAADTPPARPVPEPAAAPVRKAERTRPVRNRDAGEEVSGGRRFGRVLMLLLLVAALGAAGWAAAVPYRDTVMGLITSVTSFSSSSQALAIADRKSLESPPLAGFSASPEATDAKLQETALWRVIKREFPDWYAQRLNDAVTLAKAGSDETAISQQMARKLVELRRQQVANALSATLPKLNLVASAFHTNLAKLRAQGTDACFAFISAGEAHPMVVAMLRGSEHTSHLQAQLTAVFEAIAEGRKQPRVYPQPRQADYDLLAAELTKRGWTQADMALFSDEKALAKAAPEKVCQMVHDWFAAQLELGNTEAQMRLLVESLRPVVAG